MNQNADMKLLADQLWKYFEPKVKKLMSSQVSFFRAEVTAAPADGTITVQRPFDDPITLPYTTSAEFLAVGDQATVFVFGSLSNAVVMGNGTLTIPPTEPEA